MKFSYAHFPRGTEVEVTLFGKTEQLTVDHLVQNGVRSVVFVSTEYNPVMEMKKSYNIDHVSKIIKRGQGAVVFENRGDSFPFIDCTYGKKSKSRYQEYGSIDSLVRFMACQQLPRHAAFNHEHLTNMITDVSNPLGVKTKRVTDYTRVQSVSKKRLKKYLRQNINRFLKPLKVAEKEEREMYEECDDWRESFYEAPKQTEVTAEDLLTASHYSKIVAKRREGYKGLLTSEEALIQSQPNQRMTTVTSMLNNSFFFSDDHCFGGDILPKHWVPCSFSFPMNVKPREGLEDGVVDTVEKYIKIFHDGETQITSIEELVKLINSDTSSTREDSHYDDLDYSQDFGSETLLDRADAATSSDAFEEIAPSDFINYDNKNPI